MSNQEIKSGIKLDDYVSRTFVWGEVLYLQNLDLYCYPTKFQAENIKYFLNKKVEQVQSFLGKRLNIKSGIRPQKYNEFINGAIDSKHKDGLAIDFDIIGLTCDQIRSLLIPKLKEFDIRMENLPGSTWVHIDNGPVIHSRYFIP